MSIFSFFSSLNTPSSFPLKVHTSWTVPLNRKLRRCGQLLAPQGCVRQFKSATGPHSARERSNGRFCLKTLVRAFWATRLQLRQGNRKTSKPLTPVACAECKAWTPTSQHFLRCPAHSTKFCVWEPLLQPVPKRKFFILLFSFSLFLYVRIMYYNIRIP